MVDLKHELAARLPAAAAAALAVRSSLGQPQVLAGAVASGVFLHVAAYRWGEWDLLLPDLVAGYAGVVAVAAVGLHLLAEQAPAAAGAVVGDSAVATALAVLRLFALHIAGVFLSMAVYRVFFHRLRRYPGPFLGKLSNLYPTYLRAKRLHLFREVEALHKQYGDYFRLGPSELSIVDPKAVEAIYSSRSPCSKGPFYNVLHPHTSLHMIRDRAEHARRRKVWDRGFSVKALHDYEPRIHTYTDQLLQRIDEFHGQVFNAAEWFNFYSFDVMGDLSFGKPFNMLRDRTSHYFMKNLHQDMTVNGYLAHITWLFPLVKVTPVINTEHLKFWDWCHEQVLQRMRNPPTVPDIFSWLLEDYEKRPKTKQADLDLDGDAYLICVAGSDTTAASLSAIVFELSQHPAAAATLQAELDEYFAEHGDHVDNLSLSKLPYLNAVINEALRLHPAVPSGLQRVTPPEGLQIGDHHVPGNTIVQVPLHMIHHDERNFVQADDFIPERFTTRRDLVLNPGAYAPFSIGVYSCVGKQLGLMELRFVVSQLMHRYNVVPGPNQTAEDFWDTKRDTFTLAQPKLDVSFQPRTAKA